MKKPILILMTGVMLAVGAYAALYLARTGQVPAETGSELLWLREEFPLSDEEFTRIRELHEGYLPDCERMCAQIAAANGELERLVLSTNEVTAEITQKLSEISAIRQECQARMLKHFYAVSRAMPEEQGRRYLAEMQKLTSLSNMRDHSKKDPAHVEHGHGM
ncbi:MAG: Spy/CpxP family protein refolding chaperone [Limisphaerales bacterium]